MTPELDGIPTTLLVYRQWAELYAGADIAAAFARAERTPLHKLIQWERATGRKSRFRPENEYRYDPATGALFVLIPKVYGRLVMTVWHYPRPKRAKAGSRPWPGRGSRRPDRTLAEAFA